MRPGEVLIASFSSCTSIDLHELVRIDLWMMFSCVSFPIICVQDEQFHLQFSLFEFDVSIDRPDYQFSSEDGCSDQLIVSEPINQ